MRRKLNYTIILILFFILIPYFSIVFFKNFAGEEGNVKENQQLFVQTGTQRESVYWVVCSNHKGKDRIPLEEYLIGILASTIDVSYELETLKAQAVLLRSSLLYDIEQNGGMEAKGDYYLYRNDVAWKVVWGEKFEEYYYKCEQAVAQTEGIVLFYEGNVIPGTFCGVSAAGTRNVSEEEFPYLKAAVCDKSIDAPDYLGLFTFPADMWESLSVLETDQRGYAVTIEENGAKISGEKFRMEYHLPSACIKIRKEENYLLETRGIGHGMGMDQYYANYMADTGEAKNYMDILNYFYQNISFEKIASYKNRIFGKTMDEKN